MASKIQRAEKILHNAEIQLGHAQEAVARGEIAQRNLQELMRRVAEARAGLVEAERDKTFETMPALKAEMRSVTAALSKNYTTKGEKRVFEILAAARMCGASGQSYETARLAADRIKNMATRGGGFDWPMFVNWIKASEGVANVD
jgi:hypothetical protein